MSRHYFIASSFIALFTAFVPAASGQITISHDALILQLEEGDAEEIVLNIANDGNQDVDYRFRIIPGDLSDQLRRDDRGGPDEAEYEWRDSNEDDGPIYDWIDLSDEDQFEGVERVNNPTDDGFFGMFELGFEIPYYGNVYEEFGIHSNGFATLVSAAAIGFHYPGWERLPNARPGDAANTPPPTLMAVSYLDLNPANRGEILYWHDDYMAVITWNEVPEFMDDQGEDPWTFQLVLNADGLVKYQYHTIGSYDPNALHLIVGLQNEDRDLGFTVAFNEGDYLEDEMALAFGPPAAWVNWLHTEPMSGSIAAGSDQDIVVEIDPSNLDAGYYHARLRLSFSGGIPDYDIPVVLSYGSPVGSISGTVTDASNDNAIPGAEVNLNEIDYTIWTDDDGAFAFEGVPVGNWDITVNADNFNRFDERDIAVADGDVTDVGIAMLHGQFALNREMVNEQLPPDENIAIAVVASNRGNADVAFSAERRLVGDADAEPWELRREFNAGEELGDDRLQGVAFADDHFYVVGAAGDATNQVYILDRNGEETGRFDQVGEARYGMKDIAYDGNLIWGAGELELFGYDLQGGLQTRFEGPFNPTNNLAWDEDRGVLWCSGTTTNIQAIDRIGNLVGQPLNRRGLRIYGLAVFPEDPDGFTIFILNNPSAELGSFIHKMHPVTGDTIRVRQISAGGTPLNEAIEITNEYDIYSWVILTALNRPGNQGGDQIRITQLDARKDWMSIDPTEGVVDAGGEVEFTLTLDAEGLPEAEFVGEILFTHNGRGGSLALPLSLNVVGGPAQAVRQVDLIAGWNLISVNVQPDEADVREVTRELVENDQLILMKDGFGHFYHPQSGFSNIPDWDVAQGYQFKATEACALRVEGMSVLADDPIQLRRGWQTIAYFPRVAIDAIAALAGIRDHIVLVKDGFGNFYLPSHNFSNMGDLREGRGYQIRVDEDVELVYQVNGQAAQFARHEGLTPRHFPVVPPTGRDMSLFVQSNVEDGELAVFAGNLMVGSGVIRNGICGVAVRGDDPTTAAIDGAQEAQALTLQTWDGVTEFDGTLSVESGSDVYMTDALTVGSIKANIAPRVFALEAVFPNPFNSSATVSFSLPDASQVYVELFDQTGRAVLKLSEGVRSAGIHRLTLDGKALPSGVYIVKVATPTASLKTKALLIR